MVRRCVHPKPDRQDIDVVKGREVSVEMRVTPPPPEAGDRKPRASTDSSRLQIYPPVLSHSPDRLLVYSQGQSNSEPSLQSSDICSYCLRDDLPSPLHGKQRVWGGTSSTTQSHTSRLRCVPNSGYLFSWSPQGSLLLERHLPTSSAFKPFPLVP